MADQFRAPLARDEMAEVVAIMRWGQYVRPQPADERRMRGILAVRDARASTMPWHELQKFALTVIGCYLIAVMGDAVSPGAASALG